MISQRQYIDSKKSMFRQVVIFAPDFDTSIGFEWRGDTLPSKKADTPSLRDQLFCFVSCMSLEEISLRRQAVLRFLGSFPRSFNMNAGIIAQDHNLL
jgi:hypothetical protein